MKRARQSAAIWFGVLLSLVFPLSLTLAADDENDEYQLNLYPHYDVGDKLSVFGNFGYVDNPGNYSKYRFGWPGLIYSATPLLQIWGGLDAYYTDNDGSADSLELRPFAGIKLSVENKSKIRFYNLTRYEHRSIQNQDTYQWDSYSRIRSRFGIVVPFTVPTRAWEPKTFYGFSDVELFYRFDSDTWDPLRVRGGLGYVVNERVQMELIYTAGFTRSSSGSSLQLTDNTLELNVKVALRRSLLGRLFNPGN